jgi:hypothetical protein
MKSSRFVAALLSAVAWLEVGSFIGLDIVIFSLAPNRYKYVCTLSLTIYLSMLCTGMTKSDKKIMKK